MLSQHEFILKVRDDLYPQIRKIESQCLELFNKQYIPGRGPTGMTGSTELEFSIQLLKSSASLLEKIGKDHGLIS